VLDEGPNDSGEIINYDARVEGFINSNESFLVYPRQTRFMFVDDSSGLDPTDPTTFLRVWPARLGLFFGGGGALAPAGATVTGRACLTRLADITP
jgi:hypothetical protein